ncbi:hypothetical protein [Acidovorax sp. Leaf160]|uniref:hypothetical protein n=1 Tax=Acidovorax sp. Leaf160 TaxID=1736280 RepID=UPI0006FAC0F2|nr:hypothetical protein [Acidovorax sp. Leaf160]KQR55643.1 hypothetical protein ASF94_04380 [Acidovorax sp. Leaf160]
MTNHTPCRATAAAENTATQALTHRVAALELLVQQLIFVMDAQGTLDADALDRWLTTCTDRMRATGSVPPIEVAALRALHAKVAQ